MNKYLLALLVILGLTSCTPKDEYYYQMHPKELQQAIKSCPEHPPQGMLCSQLQVLAERMNDLAYQLQQSPQGFGTKIIALQETIVKQRQQLKTQGASTDLKISIAENERILVDHVAVVKWLESPAS